MTLHDDPQPSNPPNPPGTAPRVEGGDPLVARYHEAVNLVPADGSDAARRARLLAAVRRLREAKAVDGVPASEVGATEGGGGSVDADKALDAFAAADERRSPLGETGKDLRARRHGGAANQPRWWIGAAASVATLGLASLLALQVQREAPTDAAAWRDAAQEAAPGRVQASAAGVAAATAASAAAQAPPMAATNNPAAATSTDSTAVMAQPTSPGAARSAAGVSPGPAITAARTPSPEEPRPVAPQARRQAAAAGQVEAKGTTKQRADSPSDVRAPVGAEDRTEDRAGRMASGASPSATEDSTAPSSAATRAPVDRAATPDSAARGVPGGLGRVDGDVGVSVGVEPAPATATATPPLDPLSEAPGPRAFPAATAQAPGRPPAAAPRPDSSAARARATDLSAATAANGNAVAAGAAAAPTAPAAPQPESRSSTLKALRDASAATPGALSTPHRPGIASPEADIVPLPPLHAAARGTAPQDLQTLQQILLMLRQTGASVDQPDAAGRTALWHAADAGQIDAARELLAAGADPRRADRRGISPLRQAERRGHEPVATLLRVGPQRP